MNTLTKSELGAEIGALNQKLGVVSTVSESGAPESAVVYFSIDENLNIYFLTRTASRKYKNFMKNPQMSFVIYNENMEKTVQLEGGATLVESPDEQTKIFPPLFGLATKDNPNPPISQMMESGLALIKISPTWARLGNFNAAAQTDTFTEVVL